MFLIAIKVAMSYYSSFDSYQNHFRGNYQSVMLLRTNKIARSYHKIIIKVVILAIIITTKL